jgi:hypothetical protein
MNERGMIQTERLSFMEKIQLYLFDENENIPEEHRFSAEQLQIKKRYATVFSYWIDKPTLSDRKIVFFMQTELGVSKPQAYRDIAAVKLLLGNVRNATKEWQRFKLISMIDKAYEIAERSKDAKAMILAADKLGKYTQLDKEDSLQIPYDEIVPQPFEFTGDVTVLGLKPISNLKEKQKHLREKYGSSLIEDAEILEQEYGEEEILP